MAWKLEEDQRQRGCERAADGGVRAPVESLRLSSVWELYWRRSRNEDGEWWQGVSDGMTEIYRAVAARETTKLDLLRARSPAVRSADALVRSALPGPPMWANSNASKNAQTPDGSQDGRRYNVTNISGCTRWTFPGKRTAYFGQSGAHR